MTVPINTVPSRNLYCQHAIYATQCQNLILILRRDHQKISNERRDYESIDEKTLSWAMSKKTMNKNSGSKRF